STRQSWASASPSCSPCSARLKPWQVSATATTARTARSSTTSRVAAEARLSHRERGWGEGRAAGAVDARCDPACLVAITSADRGSAIAKQPALTPLSPPEGTGIRIDGMRLPGIHIAAGTLYL